MTLTSALKIEDAIKAQECIVDKYDKAGNIGMIVDEWGTWFDVEPGTNPGFLYQQNTIRDALVAGVSLNIFNKHSKRVKMANIAQIVNVLQSVILTEGDKMILTPTYHVFDMYKAHQDADLVESFIESEMVGLEDEYKVPNLSESVSIDKDGKLQITVANLSLDEDYSIDAILTDSEIRSVKGEIVSGEIHEHNTFTDTDRVKKCAYEEFRAEGGKLNFIIPAASVLHLEVEI